MKCCNEGESQRRHVVIKGIVQGVGFRPFIYNLAKKHSLSGYVRNDGIGVTIEVEGNTKAIDEFLITVRENPPPRATIFDIKIREMDLLGKSNFQILKSRDRADKFVPVSPEIATCPECLAELSDPSDRRYRYPFTNCTNCGPRFTIVKDVPYDRKFTTMSPFPMCDKCQREYDNPEDRRFHAQPNACPVCGPRLELLDKTGGSVESDDVIGDACKLLRQGSILAIKGLGGYHIACSAQDNRAVETLRDRKYREYKPFALMVKDIDTARQLCYVNKGEEEILQGVIRPIVLLRKKPDGPISAAIAPNQNYNGVMLPYTPLHYLLLKESKLILVMTSGNVSSEPIVYQDDEGLDRLKGIADYFVANNRDIHIRTDDSVVRVWRGSETVLRRSRGYAPFPILLHFNFQAQLLSCGAELKNTICLTRDNYAFMSHHIGDLENIETLTSFEEGIDHFQRLFNISPEYIVFDNHPNYLSTKHALSIEGKQKIGVQHHHAHIVSCMGDNAIDGEVLGVAFDGTGYGDDGNIWGGEFLQCDYAGFNRLGHLEYMRLPGGEWAIKEPWRIAASYLYSTYGNDMLDLDIEFIDSLDREKWSVMRRMLDTGINSPLTSSAGRLFDAVSALIGVRRQVFYEGQAAIELEMAISEDETGVYSFDTKMSGDVKIVLLKKIIQGIVKDLAHDQKKGSIAAKFHNTVAEIILTLCVGFRERSGLTRVALSGGVFQNVYLLERTFSLLNNNGFAVYTHHRIPTNDGGISLGQVIIANKLLEKGMVGR